MKRLFNTTTAAVLVLSAGVSPNFAQTSGVERPAAQESDASSREVKTKFYCDRTALTADQRKRQQEIGKVLRSSVLGVQELADGYEFEWQFNPETYNALAEFTPMEHSCCPFLDISLRVERAGKVWFRVTGDDGAKQFIRAEFTPWFKNRSAN